MNKKDKDKLFILAFILVYIGLFIAFCLGTVKIPFTWLIISVLLIHYVVLLPRADRLYYQVHESQIGCSRFIPIWNEISIFSGKWAIISLISYVLVALSALALFVPSSFLADYLGEFVMFRWYTVVFRIIIMLVMCNAVITGIGYFNVQKAVNRIHSDMLASTARLSFWEYLLYILYFIPVIRVIPVVYLVDRLNKIVVLNEYKINQAPDRLEEVNE